MDTKIFIILLGLAFLNLYLIIVCNKLKKAVNRLEDFAIIMSIHVNELQKTINEESNNENKVL